MMASTVWLFLMLEFAGGIEGVVLDPAGAPVRGAEVSLRTAQQAQAAQGRSDGEGRFALTPPTGGSYLLRVEARGFAPYQAVAHLAAGAVVRHTVRLSLSPVSSEVTVSAEAGSVVAAAETAQRITGLERGEIEERAVTTLTEAARGLAGVAEQRTAPAMGGFFVRGLTGKNVAVYRDGVRYTTSAQRGGVSTFQNLVDASWLERVEMVRGPHSAQYGSDSMGGAVHLVSRAPSFAAGEPAVRAEQGFFYHSASNSIGEQTRVSAAGRRVAALAAVAARRVNRTRAGQGQDSRAAVRRFLGLDPAIFGERLNDTGFTQYGGMLRLQAQASPLDHVSLHYERGQQDGARRYDQLLGGDGNLIADLRNLMLDFGYVRWERFQAGWLDRASASASYNAQREERVNQGGQGNAAGAITHQYERLSSWGVQAQGEKRARGHALAGGLEGYRERMRSPAYSWSPVTGAVIRTRPRVPDGAEYASYGIFVQEAWSPAAAGRLRLAGALRWGGGAYRAPGDSLTANGWTGRVGAVVRAGGGISAQGYYSRGFRVPNMTDLGTLGLQGNGFYETSAAGVAGRGAEIGDSAAATALTTGRPVKQLVPETADNWEAGVNWQRGGVRVEASYFLLRLGDAVVSQALILPPGAVGQPLGDQVISAQLPNGVVFVPAAVNPVLVRANLGGADLRGVEQTLKWRMKGAWFLTQNLTWTEARERGSWAPPDIEPGVPAPAANVSLLWSPSRRRIWVEAYGMAADRQSRLSSLALADRRIGAARSQASIASFFRNGAAARGLVRGGRLAATGETLEQVQRRVLGGAASAPMYTAVAGYAVFGVRAGFPMGGRSEVMIDFYNLTDRNWRGVGWGIDADGRGVTLRWKARL